MSGTACGIIKLRFRTTHHRKRWSPSPLVVPKILCSLFASQNFDHYANSHSLYRPQGVVVFVAPFCKQKRGIISSLIFNIIFFGALLRPYTLHFAFCTLRFRE